MQIVIDIPEEDYKDCIKYDAMTSRIRKAIQGGTLLSKGHGRLIDADALNRKDVNCANVPMNFIDMAPTIIEADR